ncbi:MAG: class I SAM-dependent methyltransferase [Thermoleophilia bacterium]|nr:class I SAM-dependent methyltransferase [Thermoleophilia bacterium]
MGATQQQIYAGLDADLSWSERELPERERTKHVHRLHPYLGKYIPQLVEELFRRHVPARGRVLDPFAGSGTTLVQALESGLHSVGVDIAAFNCLLMRVKTSEHVPFVLERELRDALRRFEHGEGEGRGDGRYVREWFAPQARDDLLRFRSLVGDYEHADVLRVVLARAARSARLTTHFDLDFPKAPQTGPYWCHKHKRECRPVEKADHFLRRYTLDTLARLKEFARVRTARRADVLHGDAGEIELSGLFDAVVTSPPYPGLIDYHEQHRYAYELLGLDDLRVREIGAAARGTARAAIDSYVAGIVRVLDACTEVLKPRGRLVIVVNDRRGLYPEILERAGLALEQRYQRHVNRRTGRRAGEYFEDVLVARRT